MNNKEKAKLAGISNSINKASKLQKCNSDAQTLALKWLIYAVIKLSTVAPKPRAEGSSPSAPAKHESR